MKHALIIICIAAITFLSCKKSDKTECEYWAYWEECKPKSPAVYCSNTYNMQGHVCGEQLDAARAGRAYVRTSNSDVTITVHYERRIR